MYRYDQEFSCDKFISYINPVWQNCEMVIFNKMSVVRMTSMKEIEQYLGML